MANEEAPPQESPAEGWDDESVQYNCETKELSSKERKEKGDN